MPKLEIIKITDASKQRIKELMDIAPEGSIGLRVDISTGGCSGYKYEIDFASEVLPLEEVVDLEYAKVIISTKATMMLIGSTMEYKEDKFSSGFDFTNPNETGRCGCGESFVV
ncbi:MAG: HesB/IscA family protein [Alphaproteobacteria bacterium]